MSGLFIALARPVAGTGTAPRLQRACACAGKASSEGECEECKKRRVQRQAGGPFALAPPRAAALPHDALAGFERGGVPLAPAWRRQLEPLFGTGFAAVRVHDDASSHAAARALNAHAFTVGQHVHFAAGRFEPTSRDGLHLLAHELAHTVQQRGAGPAAGAQRDARGAGIEIDASDAPLERDADAHADAVLAGRATRVRAGSAAGGALAARLQRDVGPAVEEDRPSGDGNGVLIRRMLEEQDCITTPDKQSTPRDKIFKWDREARAVKLDYTLCYGSVKLTANTSIDYSRVLEAGKQVLDTLRSNPAAGNDLPALAGNALDSATINMQGEVALTVDGILRASVGAESTAGTAQQGIRVTGRVKITPKGVSFTITGFVDAQRTPTLAAEHYSLSLKVGTQWFAVDLGYKLEDKRPLGEAPTKRGTIELGAEIPLPNIGPLKDVTVKPSLSIDPDPGGGRSPGLTPGISFGGKFGGPDKTERVSCWRCECPPPKPKYRCTPYGTRKVVDRAETRRRVPLMYRYDSTAPVDAKAFDGSVGSVAALVGEGYEVRAVRGQASPEGSREYNQALSQRRAAHAHTELGKKLPAGTALPAPEGAGELFGDSVADADKEAADRDLIAQLVAELKGKSDDERLDLLDVGDTVRADPGQRKQALADIEAFVQGKDAKGSLKQRPRWEKVFPFMRRVDVQVLLAEKSHPEREPKPEQAGECSAEDRAYVDSRRPIPPEHRLPTKKCRE
jgi:hypothetical protein